MQIPCLVRLLSKLAGSSFVAAKNGLKGNVLPVLSLLVLNVKRIMKYAFGWGQKAIEEGEER
jgi:hypothetical protein